MRIGNLHKFGDADKTVIAVDINCDLTMVKKCMLRSILILQGVTGLKCPAI